MGKLLRHLIFTPIITGIAAYAYCNPQITVTITGLNKTITQNLSNSLPLKQSSITNKTPPGRIKLLYRQGISELTESLKPLGYYSAKVHGTLTHSKDTWQASYEVTPGAPILISKTDIDVTDAGKKFDAFKHIILKSKLSPGAVFIHSRYMDLKSKLMDKAISLGFFNATFTQHQVQISLFTHQAEIFLHFNTGKRFKLGKVTFSQTGYHFYDHFLHGYVPFSTGQYFSTKRINDLQNNMNNAGYFQTTYIDTHNNDKTHTTNITVKTHTLPSQQYTIGPGYGTETGPRILLGWKFRHITQSGQHFSAQIQLSKIYRNLTMAYIIPGKNPATDFYSLDAGQHYTDISAYESKDSMFGATYVKSRGDFSTRFGIHEHWITYTPQNQSKNHAYYLVPSANLLYQVQRRKGYFKEGLSISLLAQGALKGALSQTSFLQGIGTAKLSLPIMHSNRILLYGTIGATKVSKYTDLSPTYRFYVGGLGSLLGYQYKSLSPLNGNGDLVGGKNLLTAGVQFEQHIAGNVSGIILYNVGNAFNQFQDMQLKEAAGIGISYRSAIGPINLYVAKPINDNSHKKIRFNFSIGWYI